MAKIAISLTGDSMTIWEYPAEWSEDMSLAPTNSVFDKLVGNIVLPSLGPGLPYWISSVHYRGNNRLWGPGEAWGGAYLQVGPWCIGRPYRSADHDIESLRLVITALLAIARRDGHEFVIIPHRKGSYECQRG